MALLGMLLASVPAALHAQDGPHGQTPEAVEINYFSAIAMDDHMLPQWESVSELETRRYYIHPHGHSDGDRHANQHSDRYDHSNLNGHDHGNGNRDDTRSDGLLLSRDSTVIRTGTSGRAGQSAISASTDQAQPSSLR